MAFLARMVRLGLSAAVLGGLALGATGCAGFFVCENKPACPASGTTGSTTADYAYVSNSATGSTYINGYAVSGGTLTAATGSPYNLGFVPQAMVVTPNNSFLYVASPLTSGIAYIYGYSIGTGGALSLINSGTALASEPTAAMTMSLDGNYLFVLNSTTEELDQFTVNTSSGGLTLTGSYPYVGANGNTSVSVLSVKEAPSGDFLVCVLGQGGVLTFPYNSSTGMVNSSFFTIPPANSSSGFYSAAVDANGYLYVAGTAGLQVYSTTSTGVATQVSSTAYAIGNGPRATVLNSTSSYVYTANEGSGTITADAVGTSGALTTISGSPFSGPPSVGDLGVDSSGTYLVAAGSSSSTGIQLFSIGTGGALSLLGSAASGTSGAGPIVIAMTH
jgi:6-phosphogluconolactonase